MKHQATAYLDDTWLELEGSNIYEPFDLISDGLILLPYCYKGLWVSLGVYLQAKVVYDRYKEQLINRKKVNIKGYSLGAGIGCIVALMLLKDGFKGSIFIEGKGGLKSLGSKARDYLYRVTVSVSWNTRHCDPVPHFGWWYAPYNYTVVLGEKRQHAFDYDIAEHLKY